MALSKKTKQPEWWFKWLIVGCFIVMIAVLIHRKLTGQKGKWGPNSQPSPTLLVSSLFAEHFALNQSTQSTQSSKNDSKGELECRKFLETYLNTPFSKARPDFLKNPITGNNLEIDCFSPILKLGVEYNGQQHYKYNSFFHRNIDASTNQKYRDELKRRICQENGVTLIEVPYTIKLNDIGPFLYQKLTQLGFL